VRRRVRAELDLPEDAFVVGTVGRLQAIKGVEHLVDAVASLDATLLVAGDGPERARLEERARERGAAERIRFLGTRGDVPDLLCALDVFALHSFSESFAIAVAEALLLEVPVVATDVGAIPEVTDRGRFARLVPPGDARALADAIRWSREHAEEAAESARQGKRFVSERWSTEAAAAAQVRVYDEILAGGRA
ncbi:glycosyltransferase, partial [bacterium]|nr:glycosyltransferase [bacterium]